MIFIAKRICTSLLICFIFILVFSLSASAAVLTINEIRSNQQLQSAELGVELANSLVLTTGADILYLSSNFDYTSKGQESTYSIRVNGNVAAPNLGMKVHLNNNQTRPYIRGSLFRVFTDLSVEEEQNGETEELIEKEIKETIDDVLGVTGGKLGLGAEYRINENFALAGETGMRFLFNSVDYEEESWSSEVSGLLGATYSNLAVNFYF